MKTGKNTFKYQVKLNGAIIERGSTFDLHRRTADVTTRFPEAKVEQIGGKVTLQEAELWLKEKADEANYTA